MPLPQHVTKDVGGTVYLDLLARPAAAPTLTAYQDNGTTVVDAKTSTLAAADTTITTALVKGATQLVVASATGIVRGQKLWLQDDPEAVLVRRVDGTTIYLQRPVLKAHVNGAAVVSTRASYAVTAAEAAETFWDGRVKWTVDGVIKWTALECTLYPLDRVADAQDLFDENPKVADVVDTEEEMERSLDAAHRHVLSLIGARGRARVFPGSDAFIVCTALAWWKRHYRPLKGEANKEMYDRYRAELVEEISRTVETTPRDLNQDGIITESEKMSFSSIPLARR